MLSGGVTSEEPTRYREVVLTSWARSFPLPMESQTLDCIDSLLMLWSEALAVFACGDKRQSPLILTHLRAKSLAVLA